MTNTHGGVLLLVKFQLWSETLLKVTLLHECFSRFSNCTNGTKLRKVPRISPTRFDAPFKPPKHISYEMKPEQREEEK